MHQLLEHSMNWGPIVGLIICFSLFVAVLCYQLCDRRPRFQERMSSMPLDGEEKGGL